MPPGPTSLVSQTICCPAVKFHELEDETPVELNGVKFTPIPVDHPVPTHGFLIEENGKAVLWSSDTGPTLRLWQIANRTRNLQAVCVDTSFDNSLQEIADVSFHLTPRTLQQELEKLEVEVPILLHHLKPPCVERIPRRGPAAEESQHRVPRTGQDLRVLIPGTPCLAAPGTPRTQYIADSGASRH